jgi:kumamolisin
MPNQVADAYDFPKESMGAGQSVAIIELNGGLDLAENEKYYKEHNLPLPKIQIVELNGGKNKPGGPDDSEVVLDSQVIGAIAPEANQQLIFANRSDQGFVDAVLRATFAHEGEIQNSAISISWGARESSWDPQALRAMDLALKKAALKGITVFAASGDAGAGDLNPGQHDDGKFVADFPASDPWVTATGGTRMTIDASTGKPVEVVWNDSPLKTTGGGISQLFEVPDYQKDLKMPSNPKPFNPDGPKVGRGAPDIAGNASPATGFIIRLNGKDVTSGGTSAVAPMYAALMMRVNSILKRPAGFINPFLYKNAGSPMFNDIVVGNNNGFEAGPGWDAATGLGSLRGREFLKRLQEQTPPASTRLA